MPHIPEEDKKYFEFDIGRLIESLVSEYDIDDREGPLNYIISEIIARGFRPKEGWRYKYLNRAVGTFEGAKAEFQRLLVNPYEDKCIQKNGCAPSLSEFLIPIPLDVKEFQGKADEMKENLEEEGLLVKEKYRKNFLAGDSILS